MFMPHMSICLKQMKKSYYLLYTEEYYVICGSELFHLSDLFHLFILLPFDRNTVLKKR